MKNKVKLTVWDVALSEKIPDQAMRDNINKSISREDRLKYVTEFETDPKKATKDIEVAVFDAVVTNANPAAVVFLKDITPERKAQLIEISDPEARKAAITKELTDRKDALINGLKSFLPGSKRADAGPTGTSPTLGSVPPATTSFALANIQGISTGEQDDKVRPVTSPTVPANNLT